MQRLFNKIRLISIHALLAESDNRYGRPIDVQLVISIHALLAESDERAEHHANSQQEFLSTLSLRRATRFNDDFSVDSGISIHALLAESDRVE